MPAGGREPQTEVPPSTGEGTPKPSACAPPAARIWKLTPRQYERSLKALFANAPAAADRLENLLALDNRHFHNEAEHKDMPLAYVTQLIELAETTAAAVAETPTKLAPCLTTLTDAACLARTFEALLASAYRRPPTSAEVGTLVEHVRTRATSPEAGKRALAGAITGVLTSPSFLFRTELGRRGDTARTALDPWERASALSYFLTEGPPDPELREAAAADELDGAGLAAQARRLLRTPAGSAGLHRFFGEHTGAHLVTSVSKDTKVFPRFDATLAADMEQEVAAFVGHVLGEGGGKFETLLTAPYSLVTPKLAELYGVPAPAKPWTKVMLPVNQRAGLLTMGAVLAVHARETYGDPVLRGKFIRERLLCSIVPPPPPDAPALDETPAAEIKTNRQRFEQHGRDPNCRGCHQFMDPLGFPLESYDGIGRFRLKEGTQTIDTSGALIGLGATVQFRNAMEMSRTLATRPEARACFVESIFHYAYGRAPSGEDACELKSLVERFERSQGDVLALIVDVVSSAHFTTRRLVP